MAAISVGSMMYSASILKGCNPLLSRMPLCTFQKTALRGSTIINLSTFQNFAKIDHDMLSNKNENKI